MYFQIRVAEKHRDFLRFLWWKDADFWKEPIDHVVCAHVLRGVSFRACSNNALKRAAKENEKKCAMKEDST